MLAHHLQLYTLVSHVPVEAREFKGLVTERVDEVDATEQ